MVIRMIGSNLLEVKVDHEVELTQHDVQAAHAKINVLSTGKPIALLVEKTNHYSYTFEARRIAYTNPLIFAIAYYISSEAQRGSVQTLLSISEHKHSYPIQIFTNRRDALDWLARRGADVSQVPSC